MTEEAEGEAEAVAVERAGEEREEAQKEREEAIWDALRERKKEEKLQNSSDERKILSRSWSIYEHILSFLSAN